MLIPGLISIKKEAFYTIKIQNNIGCKILQNYLFPHLLKRKLMLFSVLPLSWCKLPQQLLWLYLITESKAQLFYLWKIIKSSLHVALNVHCTLTRLDTKIHWDSFIFMSIPRDLLTRFCPNLVRNKNNFPCRQKTCQIYCYHWLNLLQFIQADFHAEEQRSKLGQN